jgi:hypothetical protein
MGFSYPWYLDINYPQISKVDYIWEYFLQFLKLFYVMSEIVQKKKFNN